MVAILTHLDSLNGAALTLEQHILANRKHGNVDDQRRLALRIYDEAFIKCAVASAAVSVNCVPIGVVVLHGSVDILCGIAGHTHRFQHHSMESILTHAFGFVKATVAGVSRRSFGVVANPEFVAQFPDAHHDGWPRCMHRVDHIGRIEELTGGSCKRQVLVAAAIVERAETGG